MKRIERRARVKAKKLAQKAAKKAAREAAALAPAEQAHSSASGQAASGVVAPADVATAHDAAGSETETGTVPRPTAAGDSPLCETPAPEPATLVDQVAAARELHKASDVLTDAEAVAMLSRAARLLDDVIATSKAALATVTPARLREALELASTQPTPAEGNAHSTGSGQAQQRPRRGYDAVLTLVKLAISAASLQTRVINKLRISQTRRAA